MYQLPAVSNDLTKSQIKIIAEAVIHDLGENGRMIEAAETLSKMEFLIKEIKASKNFVDYVRDEVSKYGKELTTSTGVKIELAEVGTKYDYSQCNDEVLSELEFQLTIAEARVKERRDFLKTLPLSGIDVLLDGGEVTRIFPPSKSSTSSFKTTLNK